MLQLPSPLGELLQPPFGTALVEISELIVPDHILALGQKYDKKIYDKKYDIK